MIYVFSEVFFIYMYQTYISVSEHTHTATYIHMLVYQHVMYCIGLFCHFICLRMYVAIHAGFINDQNHILCMHIRITHVTRSVIKAMYECTCIIYIHCNCMNVHVFRYNCMSAWYSN